MNNLYISLYDKENNDSIENIFNSKVDYYKYKLFKYCYKSDVFNNKFSNNMSLKFDINYILNNALKENKIDITKLKIKSQLKKELRYIPNLNVIFDKTYDNMNQKNKKIIKEYIFNLLNQNDNIELNEIHWNNNMYVNDSKYIESYIKDADININKLKILLIFDDISDYNENKVREYISKYKFVDILKMPNINKNDSKKMLESIEKINQEYGSTIEMIQRKNIQNYHIYIMFSKVELKQFYLHYILKKKSKYIDMNDNENDIYDENVIEYEKNKSFILTQAERLNIDIEKYNKNKIGKVILNKDKT